MLERDFLLPELREAVHHARVDGTIAVQARQTLEETRWLLQMAAESEGQDGRRLIYGVVGWAPIAQPEFEAELERLRTDGALRGLRHIVQGEPAGFLEGLSFNAGIRALEPTGLVYELLLAGGKRPEQMQEAAAFLDRHPRQRFVLDHAAKPLIAQGELEPWARVIREMARRENVTCKVSGLVTEADWVGWTPRSLRPYLDVVVEAFGPERLMAGSDWPVCLVASDYGRWWQVLEGYFEGFSAAERDAVFGGVAGKVYGVGAAAERVRSVIQTGEERNAE